MGTHAALIMTLGLATASLAQAEPTLRLFGNPNEFLHPFTISADGRVPGGIFMSIEGTTAGTWTPGHGVVTMSALLNPDEQMPSVQALSADGRVAAVSHATLDGFFALRWAEDGSVVELGDLGGPGQPDTLPHAVSAGGSFITGGSKSPLGFEAFVWSADGGMIPLGVLGTNARGSISEGLWVSEDGSEVRGLSTTADGIAIYQWSANDGMTALSDTMPSESWWAFASPDGTAIAGSAFSRDTQGARLQTAFLWTPDSGLRTLPSYPDGNLFTPLGVANSGRVVVGYNGVWALDGGLQSMAEILADGSNPWWSARGYGPQAVSADGNTIAGHVFAHLSDGLAQLGFLYTFDNPCPADLNRDGRADVFDLIDFLRAYHAGDYFADENLDGRLDVTDLQEYLGVLTRGCP